MKLLVSKSKSGIPIIRFTITTKAQRRKTLLRNPEVIELMVAAFLEGRRFGDIDQLIVLLKR